MKLKNVLTLGVIGLTLTSSIFPSISRYKVYADEETNVITTVPVTTTYLTGYLDETGQIQFYTSVGQDRSVTATILVFVGGTLIGYLSASVVDGIVIAATGKSGGEWVATAIRSVVGRKYTGSVTIPNPGPYTCPGIVIDHSGMCH
ncbi:hypothetical protein [Streptococcus acidominimus]|uniref:Uncharacterized protein n=1 Tax=Streptococcus acidominimus TaxID=1326 RepID=A0A4Y9FK64_STRAI|nr:hypothetical protein [Streptococcus acidominimus]MBF0819784.1 hypothetical protein [Streptococcus acidominimus]MBF0838185.1 hypothetical protein [Streptococcus acidominimus]MBF0846506.1 hypothetical protein [Streptococcus danieliae]TFU29446.1 hypothetical protein E4U01_10045 [Streptococcus acidominimus]